MKATLSNNFGGSLMASYKWTDFKFYGGYIYANLSNPSSSYASGFETTSNGIFVPGGAVTSTTPYASAPVNTPAFPHRRLTSG